jgi:hypothetical protein
MNRVLGALQRSARAELLRDRRVVASTFVGVRAARLAPRAPAGLVAAATAAVQSAGTSMVGAARAAGRRYDGLLKSHKLTVTTISGAVLAAAGDACTQAATSEGGKPLAYDAKRGLTFALFGALVTGPINCFWLTRLDTVVRWLAPAGGRIATSAKVATQTFFFQPIVCAPCGLSNPRLRLAATTPRRSSRCGASGHLS